MPEQDHEILKKYNKAYYNNLLRLMNKETDIKELRQAYNNLKALKQINGNLNKNELQRFKNKLNNEPIFNLCLLLLHEY